MSPSDIYDALIDGFIKAAGDKDRFEIDEGQVLTAVQAVAGPPSEAHEIWEPISKQLLKRIVRRDYIVQWDMFRRVVKLWKLPTIEELESACELYQNVTPREIERRILGLTGLEFETFLASLLTRLPQFREIATTRQSHDEGIDLKGIYVPGANSPHFVLIGQAKRVVSPVSAHQARDFIGALHLSGERGLVGLFVSTGGFTQPAQDALDKCNVRIMCWDLATLIEHSKELTMRRVELSFGVPDNTFWDEILGRS